MAMRPSQYMSFLEKSLLMMPRRAILVSGPAGVGKSECTKQVCEKLGFELEDIRLSLLDSIDLRGLPIINKDKRETTWTKPDFLPPEDYDKDIVLFFDEFNTANKSMQNACLQLILDRKIGRYTLPEKARVICAGNRLQDGGFVTRLSAPMNNRFIHIELEPNFEDWKAYAYRKRINPLVIGFHNYTRGINLHNYKEDVDNKAFASQRTWFFVGEPDGVLDLNLDNGTLFEVIKGTIGEGVGTDFYGYLKIYKDLPNPDDILNGKNIIPKEPNILYALCSALINRVLDNKEKLERLIEYSLKIEKEFSVVLVKDLIKTELRNSLIDSSTPAGKAYEKWAKANMDVIV